MARRKTHEEFEKEVLELTSGEYTILGTYTNQITKLMMRHNKCGHEYKVKPRGFLSGNRCPSCNNKTKGARHKTQKEYEDEVYKLSKGEYTVVGKYVSVLEKVPLLHKRCGNIWNVTPNAFLSGRNSCVSCARKDTGILNRKTHEQYVKDVAELYGDEMEILGEYTLSSNKIKVRHWCGHTWDVLASGLLESQGCPGCKSSKGERLVRRVLRNLNIEFEEQKTFPDLKNAYLLSYDFYIPESKVLIEYQGIQHYEPTSFGGGEDPHERLKYQQNNDNLKREYSRKNGYNLIEIHYKNKTYEDIENILYKQLK